MVDVGVEMRGTRVVQRVEVTGVTRVVERLR